MQSLTRTVVLFGIGLVLFVLLMVFLTVVLKIAVVAALLAFSYYWFTRATETRRRSRNWR